MGNLVKKVQNTNFQENLFKNNSRIVLGISGGPDSACLLDIFCRLKKKYPLELILAHVNYDLRGIDSQKDEQLVKKLAHKHALVLEVLRPKIKKTNNLEKRLRDLRYAFFEKTREKYSFDLIATAHNLDDQAETFLLNLLRGAGIDGLSAMRFKRDRLIRPLLNIPRKEIIQHLKEKKIVYRIDKTNRQPIFLRNKIRLKLIPYLEKYFNPNIKHTLFLTAAHLNEDRELIAQLKTTNPIPQQKTLSFDQLRKLPRASQKRVLLDWLNQDEIENSVRKLSQTEEILRALKSQKNKIKTTHIGSLKIVQRGDKILKEKNQASY